MKLYSACLAVCVLKTCLMCDRPVSYRHPEWFESTPLGAIEFGLNLPILVPQLVAPTGVNHNRETAVPFSDIVVLTRLTKAQPY